MTVQRYMLLTACACLVCFGVSLIGAEETATPVDSSTDLRIQYGEQLNQISKADAAQRYALAHWLVGQYDYKAKNIEALDMALTELNAVLELDPKNADAASLYQILKETRKDAYGKLHPDFWKMAFSVIGGLGLFLLGMKNMSEGIQAVAGQRLRRMIGFVTDNRILAVITGILVTCMIQSSSITTVMVVGFVNSGLMVLHQAIGVIMGANIGTTITGWILVLKIGKYGLPIVGVATFVFLFTKSERIRYVAMALLGLGLVFFGLEMMKNGFKPMKDYPPFETAFAIFTADSYLGVLKCAAAGCILTFIVQSSSATLGITIGMAQVGAIPFESAAALVLGENIGTTVTAWLASIGATTNAKRAAYAHVMFNLIGAAWSTALFTHLLPLIGSAVQSSTGHNPIGLEMSALGNNKKIFESAVTAGIAVTHTSFNFLNTLLFLPFVRIFARFLEKVVRDRGVKESPHLTHLNISMLDTPGLGIQRSLDELKRMSQSAEKMMRLLRDELSSDEIDEKRRSKIFRREEILDTVQKEITEFITGILSGHVTHDVIEESRRQLRLADEYESISDYAVGILKLRIRLEESGLSFSEQGRTEILNLHDQVYRYLVWITERIDTPSPDILTRANTEGRDITHHMRQYRERHLDRVGQQKISPLKSLIYTDILMAYRKIKDHVYNIAETLAGEK